MMIDLPVNIFTPDRPLDPPEGRRRDHDWAAVFRCHIGDGDLPVKVYCDVTRNDEIDFETINVFIEPSHSGHRHDIEVTAVLDKEIRAQIVRQFEDDFEDIYEYNHR